MNSFIRFFVYSNLFIATCALALTYESFLLLHLPSSLNWYLLLIFLCTVFVYCLHYFIKIKKEIRNDRQQWCRQNKKLLAWLIVLSLFFIAGGAIFHFRSIFFFHRHFNPNNLAWFIIIPILALAYSYPLIPWHKKSLRQIGWLKMALLSFVWSFTTVALPIMMSPEEVDLYTRSFFVPMIFLQRFIFIGALCFLFNIRDYEEDKRDDIKTFAVLLGQRRSLQYGKWVMTVVNALFTLIFLWCFELQDTGDYIAAFIPVVLLFCLFQFYSPQKNEALFVIRNDGLMLIKALLLIFALLIFHY